MAFYGMGSPVLRFDRISSVEAIANKYKLITSYQGIFKTSVKIDSS